MDGALHENIDHDQIEDDQPFGAPMPRAFRLADAEKIAARRLEGAAEGSLKEALATVIVPPAPEASSLGDRLRGIAEPAECLAATVDATRTPEPAVAPIAPEADFSWFGAVPPAHAVPCFEERDFATLAVVELPAPAPVTADVPPAFAVAPPQIPVVAAAPFFVAESAVEPATEPLGVLAREEASVGTTALPSCEPDAAPLVQPLPEDPNLEPIVTAYAASARLAADAAAASQALFELQKLLNEQRLEASPELNTAMEAHALAQLDAIPVAQQPDADATGAPLAVAVADTGPATDACVSPPRALHPLPQRAMPAPPPLPKAVAPAARRETPAAELPKYMQPAAGPPATSRTQVRGAPRLGKPQAAPAAAPATSPARTQRRRPARPARQPDLLSTFDLRGFAAGFVLSGAIGIVLYFVMATG